MDEQFIASFSQRGFERYSRLLEQGEEIPDIVDRFTTQEEVEPFSDDAFGKTHRGESGRCRG